MAWNLISFHKYACLHLSPPTCLPLREKVPRTDGTDSPLTDKDPLTTICVPTQVAPPGMEPREVACDQQTDGGGWTLVLARHPPSAPRHHARHEQQIHRIGFNTSWEDYKKGFGDVRGEFWLGEAPQREFSKFTGDIGWVFETLIKSPFNISLHYQFSSSFLFQRTKNLYNSIKDKFSISPGNEVLHALTRDVPHQVHVHLTDWDGNTAYSTWDYFRQVTCASLS